MSEPKPRRTLQRILSEYSVVHWPELLAALREYVRAERRAEREAIVDVLRPYLESLRASGQEYASISLAEGIRRIRALPDADPEVSA